MPNYLGATILTNDLSLYSLWPHWELCTVSKMGVPFRQMKLGLRNHPQTFIIEKLKLWRFSAVYFLTTDAKKGVISLNICSIVTSKRSDYEALFLFKRFFLGTNWRSANPVWSNISSVLLFYLSIVEKFNIKTFYSVLL